MRGRAGRIIFLSTSALLLASAQVSGAQEAPEYAPQGWSEPQRNVWYSTSQGSRLMPLAWMQALERADSEQLFLAADSINRYRYLPFTTSTGSRLPVGFAIDRQDDRNLRRTRLRWLPGQGSAEPWIGLTCSACHTGEIARGNRRLRIDGAPALGHYQRFVVDADLALEATRRDSGKWSRFAGRVLGDAAENPANVTRLGQAVDELIALQTQLRRMNAIPAGYDYGFARVDAFGHIFNKTVFFAGAPGARPAGNPSTAPVSYPFLWNVPQHNLVQWNGSVANAPITHRGESLDVGAIGRNTGEVIGVFGEVVTIPRRFPGLGLPRPFVSSVNFGNLILLERMLQRLRPPAWPEGLLGPIDVAARDRGRALFGEHCASCHTPLDRADLTTPIRADMGYLRPNAERRHDGSANIPPDTDPVMACNAYTYDGESGQLVGYRQLRSNRRIAARARVVEMTSVTAINTMAGGLANIALSALEALGGFGDVDSGDPLRPGAGTRAGDPGTAPSRAASYPASLPEVYRRCVQTPWAGSQDRILGYKARPLTGIWATAPYLHNGSVPSLHELLLPPDRRAPSFFLGTRQYDPVRVGYLAERSDENSFEFRTRDERGNIIWGNYNGGHDYGNASLDEGTRRRDLLEYLKSL
jgi:hypothetical protein